MAEQEKDKQTQAATAQEGSLVDEILSITKVKPSDEAYSMTKAGLQAFVEAITKPGAEAARITQADVDKMLSEIDQKLSAQVDEILHHPDVQKMESSWRSMKFLIDRTDFRENIKIELLNVSQEDLLNDFEDAPEITKSGLYRTAYTAEFGQFGGQPYGMMVGNYAFGPGPQDIKLMQYLASVAAMSHAPFIAAAGPKMFGVESYAELPGLKDLKSIFEMPQYTKWQGFRESEDSRNIGLALPRFMLRVPYGKESVPVKSFDYTENVSAGDKAFLWGNAAFAFASRVTDSFAKYRWCANIIGPQGGGAVENLPVYNYESMGQVQTKIPVEVMISDRKEFELAEEGFMALTMRKGSDNAAFFSANSVQKPKNFGSSKEGKEAELNYRLSTQLPYMFVIARLAHYLKVLQRENIGTWKEKADLERELNNWIRQYVADQDNPAPGVRSRRPLRQAQVEVSDVEGNPGWYKVGLKVKPHFKYMGASFTLSLVGKLDKK
jgi:type VI secretion system protein ImpC